MRSLVRLFTRNDETIVVVREGIDDKVTFVFWPRNENYAHARRTAEAWLDDRLTRAIEAPRPA